ncbi:uncharacterized protein LOC144821706 isoform X2 [Lissotriton helveticus]
MLYQALILKYQEITDQFWLESEQSDDRWNELQKFVMEGWPTKNNIRLCSYNAGMTNGPSPEEMRLWRRFATVTQCNIIYSSNSTIQFT